jgi:hypothetical protein
MIAHVAEAGEGRGRVVLRLDACARASSCAIEAAVRVAQAFQSEIESLVIEDRALFDLALFPFAREVSFAGQVRGALDTVEIEKGTRLAAAALMRQVEAAARGTEVQVRRRLVRDDPIHALAAACAANGPWNVVALGEPFTPLQVPVLERLFETVSGTTGVVVAGARARRTSGPVVTLVEEVERLPPMLRAAERLAAVTGGDTRILLAAEDRQRLDWMEAQARLVMGEALGVRADGVLVGRGVGVLAEQLRRQMPGFVITRFGGLVLPEGRDLKPLTAALDCPMFLVR